MSKINLIGEWQRGEAARLLLSARRLTSERGKKLLVIAGNTALQIAEDAKGNVKKRAYRRIGETLLLTVLKD